MNPKYLVIFDLDNTLRFSKRSGGLILSMKDIDEHHPYYFETWDLIGVMLENNIAVGIATNQCAAYDSLDGGLYGKVFIESELDFYFNSMADRCFSSNWGLFDSAYSVDRKNTAKPKPDMLYWLADRFLSLPEETILVGDSWKDCLAARSFGCEFIKVGDFGYTQNGTTPMPENIPAPDLWFDSAYSAVLHLLER